MSEKVTILDYGIGNVKSLQNGLSKNKLESIITSNKEFTDWNEFFCNDTVAVPVIERIIHHSKIFMLRGESYRLRGKTRN